MQTENKKSKLSSIANLFVTTEEEIPTTNPTTKKAAQTPSRTSAPITASAYVPPPVTVVPSVSSESVNEFKLTLENEIQNKALGNFDYLKFMKSMDSLRAYIPNEAALYDAAFKAAGTMGGVTKQKLLESTTHYLSVLEQEKQDFEAANASKNQERVINAEQRITDTETSINQKQEQIKKLMDEVNDLNKQKMDMTSKLNEEKSKISASSNSFNAAFNLVAGEIRSNAKKINDNIKE